MPNVLQNFANSIIVTFSTVVITLVGEIMPQAYFSRNALRMAAEEPTMLRKW